MNGSAEPPLYGALDRFAQFFVSPLFLSETLDRELKAVDSENKKNLQSDGWRLSQLTKSLSNPKHPYHHFSTGNLKTLRDEPKKRGLEIRDEFMAFHDKHYSANRMKLVVLGREPLDQLEEWVAELFSDVLNKDLAPNRWDQVQPYSQKEALIQVFAKPVMDSRMLEIYFPYQDEEEMYRTHPSRYLSHLIGHEGPGSILSYIKAKGWANGLSTGAMPICPGSAVFSISIRLTADGLKEYQKVVEAVFQYIALLQQTAPQQWIVEEIKGMAAVDFRFKQKTPASSFTSKLSSQMQKPLPREWLLSGPRLIREFDAEAISKAMSYLRTDNYRLTIVSKDFPGDWNQREKWYGTEYRTERIPREFEEAVHQAGQSTTGERPSDLHLPHKNEFIPTRLSVERRETVDPAKAPKLIRNDEGFRTWWKKDDRFWVPRAKVNVLIRNPLVAITPVNAVKATMYCELVNDALEEYSYDASISGLEYRLQRNALGLEIGFSGYNDKLSVLLEKVLVSMRDLEVRSDRFNIIKERVIRSYRNWDYQQPYRQVGDYLRWLGVDKGWINQNFLEELPHVTPNDISLFYPQLLRQLHVEVQVHGNLYKEDALRISDLIESTLKPRPLPISQWNIRRDLLLSEGSDFTYNRTLVDPANVNHCIEYFLFVGACADMELRAKLLLFAQLTDEQGFDQLRTKEQLGYVVFTGAKFGATTMGYRVILQSERLPEYLEERINAFLALFAENLLNMSEKDFESHKKSLINKRLEKPKNLDEENSVFWAYICNEYYNFTQVETDVENLRSLTKRDMKAFFDHYIEPTSLHRAKLSVHMIAQSTPKKIEAFTSVFEQKKEVLNLLNKHFTSLGIDGNSALLSSRFENVDIAGGDEAGILNAISDHLSNDIDVQPALLTKVLDQGPQTIRTILSGLGIEAYATSGDVAHFPKAPKVKKTTHIEDVREYKASLKVSTGPKPVMDLSEFEDLEPKL